jgi:hypothetical protein
MLADVYERVFAQMIRENQVTLFRLDGAESRLDCERHVDSYCDEIADRGTDEWRRAVVQLTVDLWASWEVQMLRSGYSKYHMGAVHVEERWLSGESDSAPCAILMNADIHPPDEWTVERAPISMKWRAAGVLGGICWREFVLSGLGRCFRLYLSK